MSRLAALLLVACGAAPHPSDTPAQLDFAIVTVGRPAGDATVKIDGPKRHEHFTFNDRGRGPDVTSEIVLDDAGALASYRATGHDYLKAPVDETVTTDGGTVRWKSTSEHGEAKAGSGWFVPTAGPIDSDALLVQAIRRAPDHRVHLLPAGEAWIEDEQVIEVKGHKLHRIAIAGLGFTPTLTWLDEHDEMFGEVSAWSSLIRKGSEGDIDEMVKADEAWMAARSKRLATELAQHPPAAGLAFVHANVFDSVTKTIVPDQTVVVAGDAIVAVGDGKTKVPAGAQVIDAGGPGGKTLIPGLWDMHTHSGDGDGLLFLACGITTIRDLGNDIDSLAARVDRFDHGTEVGPRVLRAGLIDGPGQFAAPTGILVATPEEATKAVDKFVDHGGYVQIKMYSSLDPALVPVIAKHAHDRGMRVSGHIPNGMTASQAVEAGYDEIQHVNFLFLPFLVQPGDDTRTPARFTRVADGAAGLDLDRADVQAFFDLLVKHDTVLDPTLATFHAMFVSDAGELDPVLVPYTGKLPAQVERGGKSGGLPTTDRAKFKASFAALEHLVKRAWDRKIRIVAGTDDFAGLTLSHELELYVDAGIPAPDVLALATIGAARVMGQDKTSGSIAAGKQADLVLVDGDPTRDITALRKVSVVVSRGIVYDPAKLRAAVGMRP